MLPESPLISVIVPSYNHERFITGCIDSIINQTYPNFELIVIDDGSTDNSPDILRALRLKHNFTLVFQKNRGISGTLNRALKDFATGKYIAICASDDYWIAEKLEIQARYMEENPEWAMCYGKNHFVDDNSAIIPGYCRDYNLLKGGSVFDDLFLFRFHPHVNYLIRSSVFVEIGYYDERFITEDYYMNLKIASRYPIGFIDQFLGFYRIPASAQKIERYELLTQSHIQVIQTYRNHPLYKEALRRAYLRNFDAYSGFTKYKLKAVKNMMKALPLFYEKRFVAACIKLLFFSKTIDG
ncbi:MAG: glycosyltransferase [Bacteroidota bacterium]